MRFAYRELGPRGGVPVVFLHHLNAVLDDWDPRVVDGIAARRHVIAFDNRGVGGSSGSVPATVEEMGEDAATFIRALGYGQVDLLGFSLGGGVAQALMLEHPELVRRAVLAGTAPAGGAGIDKLNTVVATCVAKGALTLRDPRHFLFFPRTPTGKRAAGEYMARLRERRRDRDRAMSPLATWSQLKAIRTAGRSEPHDLGSVPHPVLVANGSDDLMVPTALSIDIADRLPDAELVIYPDSGHGGIFQYHEQFVPKVLEFLDDTSHSPRRDVQDSLG